MTEADRLRWKCRRGMLELDLLLNDFMKRGYAQLDVDGQDCFDRLLDYPDAVLLEWFMGRIRPTDKDVDQIVQRIRSTASS